MYDPSPLAMIPPVNRPRPLVTCFLPNSAKEVVDVEVDMVRRCKEVVVVVVTDPKPDPLNSGAFTDLVLLRLSIYHGIKISPEDAGRGTHDKLAKFKLREGDALDALELLNATRALDERVTVDSEGMVVNVSAVFALSGSESEAVAIVESR